MEAPVAFMKENGRNHEPFMTWSVLEMPGACGLAKDTSGTYQMLGPGGDWDGELVMLLVFDPG